MSPNAAVDIHALIAAGRVVEAGTLLAMHGEELPPDMRQELEQERQRLWQRANDLVTEGEALEQAGWTEEAWTSYQKAAKIACDLPGLQETIKRLDEAVALTKAVQHRSKRIRQKATRVAGRSNASRQRTPLLLAAVVVLGIGAGLWLIKGPSQPPPPAPQNSSPLPAASAPPPTETTPPVAAPVAATAEPMPPQPQPNDGSLPDPGNQPSPPSASPAEPPPPTIPAVNTVQAPAVQPPPTPPASLTYTVQAGDTLSLIAERQLCSAESWSKIYKKNRQLVSHADKLVIGTQLDLSGLPNRCQQPQ